MVRVHSSSEIGHGWARDTRGVDLHLPLGVWAPGAPFALSAPRAHGVEHGARRDVETRGVRVRVAAQMRPVPRGSPRCHVRAAGSSVSPGARRARKGAQLRTCVPEGGGLRAGGPGCCSGRPGDTAHPPRSTQPAAGPGVRLRTTASAARSRLAAQKLRARELWGSGLDAQTRSESPRGHRPLYNSDIFMERV